MTDLIPILILGVLVGAAGFYFALYEGRPRRSPTRGNRVIKDGEEAGNIQKSHDTRHRSISSGSPIAESDSST